MLNTSGLLYLSARIVSAAGNLLAVVIFSRLAGPAEYGHYVLIFAWSLIVYGFGAQWMRFAFFGVYQSERFGEYVGSLAGLLCGGLALVALALAVLGVFGVFEPSFLGAVFALICGMTLYEAAFEVARVRLDVHNAALSMMLRALFTVLFGSIGLWLGGGARGLALAIAVAHVGAAAPALRTWSGLRLAVDALLRHRRGRTKHRSAIAGALSRHRDARALRRRRRHVAPELHGAGRNDLAVIDDGGEKPCQ
jgi:hypothetical protein